MTNAVGVLDEHHLAGEEVAELDAEVDVRVEALLVRQLDVAADRQAAALPAAAVGRLHRARPAAGDDRVAGLGQPAADRPRQLVDRVVGLRPGRPEDGDGRARPWPSHRSLRRTRPGSAARATGRCRGRSGSVARSRSFSSSVAVGVALDHLRGLGRHRHPARPAASRRHFVHRARMPPRRCRCALAGSSPSSSILVGAVWIGQGLGLFRGSGFMDGDIRWAVIGARAGRSPASSSGWIGAQERRPRPEPARPGRLAGPDRHLRCRGGPAAGAGGRGSASSRADDARVVEAQVGQAARPGTARASCRAGPPAPSRSMNRRSSPGAMGRFRRST